MDRFLEGRRTSPRKRDCPRTMRGCEVVDIYPVGRQRTGTRRILEQCFDRLLDPCAARANREDVEPALADLSAKDDGLAGTRVSDQAAKGREVRRRFEFQSIQIRGAIEAFSRQRMDWLRHGLDFLLGLFARASGVVRFRTGYILRSKRRNSASGRVLTTSSGASQPRLA